MGGGIIFQLAFWLAVLIILLFFCYGISNGRIITPELCYIACFVPQVLQAFFYQKKWDINLSYATLGVLIGGAVLFVIVSLCTAWLFHRVKKRPFKKRNVLPVIDKKILLLFTAFQAITLLLTVYFLISSYGVSLSRAIYLFRAQSMVSYHGVDIEVTMPAVLRLFRRVTTGAGFFWAYLLMQRIILKVKENRNILLANFILSALTSFVSTGGRKGVFQLIIAALVDLYLLYGINTGWKKRIKFKSLMKLMVFGFIFIGLFKVAGEAAGKTINVNFGDYLAVYLTAPLKNLDGFVRSGDFGISDISQSTLFAHLVQYLNAKGFLSPYVDAYEVGYFRGYNLGNAYTIYFSYLHDYGYWGLIVFVSLSAIVCQFLFQKARMNNAYNISVYAVVFSFLFSNLVFAFFGNFLITSIFDVTMMWNILIWIVLSKIMKIRIKF